MDDIDYNQRGIDDLLGQWKELPRWNALVAGLAAGAEQVSGEWTAIGPDCAFDVATDNALDQWGQLIGQAREGCTDDEYRLMIAARAIALRSYGTADEVIALMAAGFGVDYAAVSVQAFPPLSYSATVLVPDYPSDQHRAAMARVFEAARANCVYGVGIVALDGDRAFQFDGPDGTGFDDGEFAGVL